MIHLGVTRSGQCANCGHIQPVTCEDRERPNAPRCCQCGGAIQEKIASPQRKSAKDSKYRYWCCPGCGRVCGNSIEVTGHLYNSRFCVKKAWHEGEFRKVGVVWLHPYSLVVTRCKRIMYEVKGPYWGGMIIECIKSMPDELRAAYRAGRVRLVKLKTYGYLHGIQAEGLVAQLGPFCSQEEIKKLVGISWSLVTEL